MKVNWPFTNKKCKEGIWKMFIITSFFLTCACFEPERIFISSCFECHLP